jgi:hypothetical protein
MPARDSLAVQVRHRWARDSLAFPVGPTEGPSDRRDASDRRRSRAAGHVVTRAGPDREAGGAIRLAERLAVRRMVHGWDRTPRTSAD